MSDKEFQGYMHAFLKRVDQYYANCTKDKDGQGTKNDEKYRKSLVNLYMYQLYTLFCIKIKIFFIFLNPGTIGTIKKVLYTNGYMLKFVPKVLGTMRYNWYNC